MKIKQRHLIFLTVLTLGIVGCQTSPKRPTTNTSAPSFSEAKDQNRRFRNDVSDAKTLIHRSRQTLNQLEDKVIKWDSGH